MKRLRGDDAGNEQEDGSFKEVWGRIRKETIRRKDWQKNGRDGRVLKTFNTATHFTDSLLWRQAILFS